MKCLTLISFELLLLLPLARAHDVKDSIFSRAETLLRSVTSGEKCQKLLVEVDHCSARIFYYFNPNLTIYTDKSSMQIDFCR